VKQLKLKFIDFWPGFDSSNNPITEVLREHFELCFAEDPDFVIYSNFGFEHLEHDVPRVFYTSENLRPDFNICDYALGFDRMSFGDRYFRFTIYMFQRQAELHAIGGRVLLSAQRKFCNFIYSNAAADPARDAFFKMLSSYKAVDSAGRHLNNTGFRVKEKQGFQKDYKFSIAFENSSTHGYCTEKIIDAYRAGTVPIYWGDPDIGLDFNSNSFVNCHAYSRFEDVVKRIIELDSDEDAFARIYEAPFFRRPLLKYAFDPGFEEFLVHIFGQDSDAAFRRNRQFWGKAYETQHKKFAHYLTRLGRNPLFNLMEHLKMLGLRGTVAKVLEKHESRKSERRANKVPET
jgi:hypothetical protein